MAEPRPDWRRCDGRAIIARRLLPDARATTTAIRSDAMNAPERLDPKSKAKFIWDDPLLLDDQLTEEERMARETARAYAQEKLLPRVTQAFRHELSDPAIFSEMGALGLLGATLPAEYGGAGSSNVCYGLIA